MKTTQTPNWNLLILSDLHLGEQAPGEARDLVQERADILDEQFGSFLEYYTQHQQHGLPWRLVIAGDLLDFMRVHVPNVEKQPAERIAITTDGRESWGIPSYDVQGTLQKLRQVFILHHKTFLRLGRFLQRGNQLVLISGNHDGELNWSEIQEAFCEELFQVTRRQFPHLRRKPFFQKIEFCPWFYYEPGRVYIEHGHLYDPYSVIDDFLVPGHRHPKQELDSPCHVASRYQNACQEALAQIPMSQINSWDIGGIVGWFLVLDWKQRLHVMRNLLMLIFQLLTIAWRRQFRRALQMDAESQHEAMTKLAQQYHLPVEVLLQLRRFSVPPVYNRFFDILQALYLDRFFLSWAAAFCATLFLVAPWPPEIRALGLTILSVAFVQSFTFLARRRPASDGLIGLFSASTKIATHLQVPLVVFGHSHKFEHRSISEKTSYINLGAWCETAIHDDADNELDLTTQHRQDTEELVALKSPGKQEKAQGDALTDPAAFMSNPYLMLTFQQAAHQLDIRSWHMPQSRVHRSFSPTVPHEEPAKT